MRDTKNKFGYCLSTTVIQVKVKADEVVNLWQQTSELHYVGGRR